MDSALTHCARYYMCIFFCACMHYYWTRLKEEELYSYNALNDIVCGSDVSAVNELIPQRGK